MSRSKHQSHPSFRKGGPNPFRNRKHKPLGLHRQSYQADVFVKLGWLPDSQEKRFMHDCCSKSKYKTESRREIQRQLDENI